MNDIKAQVQSLVQSQKNFFQTGRTKDLEFRLNSLKKLLAVIEKKEALIDGALRKDLGKPVLEAYSTEIAYVKSDLKHAIKSLKSWARPKKSIHPSCFSLPNPRFFQSLLEQL